MLTLGGKDTAIRSKAKPVQPELSVSLLADPKQLEMELDDQARRLNKLLCMDNVDKLKNFSQF